MKVRSDNGLRETTRHKVQYKGNITFERVPHSHSLLCCTDTDRVYITVDVKKSLANFLYIIWNME